MSTFFTSDLHFSHEGICKARGMTIEENNNLIINNWNKTVKKQDTIFILGDITLDNPTIISEILPKLKGSKIIIGGNHDTKRCCNEFVKLGIPVLGCLDYKEFVLTHIPIRHEETMYDCVANIHGHIHIMRTRDIHLYGQKYYNVNCEFHNYTPVSLDTIREHYKTK